MCAGEGHATKCVSSQKILSCTARDKNLVDKGNSNSNSNAKQQKDERQTRLEFIYVSNKKKRTHICVEQMQGHGVECVGCVRVRVQKFIKRKETHRKYAEILGATAARIIFK